MRKYKRSKPCMETSVPSEIVSRAQALRETDPTDKLEICKEMEACFPLHKIFLQEKKSIAEILEMFPHLTEFKGLLVIILFLGYLYWLCIFNDTLFIISDQPNIFKAVSKL